VREWFFFGANINCKFTLEGFSFDCNANIGLGECQESEKKILDLEIKLFAFHGVF
jgi:hypothetical protein